jgi:hypothetical protein
MGVQAEYRAAAVELLTDCATDAGVALQVYAGRPRSIYPPTAFIDSMADELTPTPGASNLFRHVPLVTVVCVWGAFDSKEAADQRDAFVDAFHDWIRSRRDAVSGASLIGPRALADVPTFVADWLPEVEQVPYYATRIELEGDITD